MFALWLGYVGVGLIVAAFIGMAVLCFRAPVRDDLGEWDRDLERRGL